MAKIVKIEVLSLGKILGALYAVFGVIGGILFTVIGLIAFVRTPVAGFMGLPMLVILPIFYGIMGFITGVLTAALYNLISSKIGPLVVQISE